ncbi:hypothetical protein ACHHYP_08125 [Achlya hypogyna]|uniref:Uncharacterized protein n=1 Tax=Achlya hypogyna TaxID=1202772 RepID=A0A1V9YPR1_ACHHY|nr:hypothetical protein ACHHYP_08125 [Achlya hypogyna]
MADAVAMSKMGSYCCVCHDATSGLPTTLEAAPPTLVRVLDASLVGEDASIPRELAFSGVFPAGFRPADLFAAVSSPVEQVVRDGYNTSVLCYGRARAKRALTLGARDIAPEAIASIDHALAAYGQIGGILFQLFDQAEASAYAMGLSCWSIANDRVVDHLRPLTQAAIAADADSIQFVTMHVTMLGQALALLRSSFGAGVDDSTHVFVRLAVYNVVAQELSLLHFVDLGQVLAPPEQAEFLTLFDDLVDYETARDDAPAASAARRCTLTQFVAPLLAGNSKTFLLGFVPQHSVRESLDWLWVMSGVRLITSACVKLTGIAPDLLDFHPFVAAPPKSSLTQRLFGDPKDTLGWLDKFTQRKSQILGQPDAEAARPASPLEAVAPSSPPPQATAIQPLASSMTVSPAKNTTLVAPMPPRPNRFDVLLADAHLPSMAPPAPDVDGRDSCAREATGNAGLDAKSALTVQRTEALLLRSNYDQLLRLVKDQWHRNEQLQLSVDDAHFQLTEMQTTFDVQQSQTQDLKLANVELRSKVRMLEQASGLQPLFDKYDAEMAALVKQLDDLRSRNLELELKLAQNASVDLRTRYRDVVKENVALHEELLALRKSERHFLSSKRVVDDSSRKLDKLAKLVHTKEDLLLEARLGEARLSAQVDQQQQRSAQLEQQQSRLLQENERAAEELVAVKMYLASIQNEQRKADMLDGFVKKHGADLLTHDRRRLSSPREASTALDDTLRRLLAAVKRTLPQLVPSLNKLVQRLQEQEVTLLEYSSREMDLINLLVELASDQQTLSAVQELNAPLAKKKSIA